MGMVKNDEKHWKIMKKVPFPSCAQEAHVRRMKKNVEKSLHEPYISLLYAWWKRYFFHDFRMFSILFDHANACASMHSLVEIHNTRPQNTHPNQKKFSKHYFMIGLKFWPIAASTSFQVPRSSGGQDLHGGWQMVADRLAGPCTGDVGIANSVGAC